MTAAQRLRQKLLDLAIRGKLVPQDANDEPAEVLFAKIREEKEKLVKAKKIKKEKPLPPITDEEKTFDLPKGWTWCRFGEICSKVGAGSTPKGGRSVYVDHGIKFIREQNVLNDGLCYDGMAFIDENINNHMAGTVVKPRDLLINITGASIGRTALVPDDFDIGNVNQHVLIARLIESEFRHYIHYVLCSPWILRIMLESQTGDKPGLSAEKVGAFPIPLPSLAEQKRIVVKLEELLKAADTLGKCAEKFEELSDKARAKILDLAIRGKLVPQDANDEPATELLKRISAAKDAKKSHAKSAKSAKESRPVSPARPGCPVENPPFDLPKGWAWCRLSELGQFTGGHTPSTSNSEFWDGDVIWVTSKDMKSKYIADSILKLTKLGAAELSQVPSESILMCTRSGILKRIFPVAIAKKKLTINQDQRALTLYLPEMAEYVYAVLKARESNILVKYTKEGTTVSSIDWDKFVDFPIPLPPLAEQKRIVAKVGAMLAACDKLKGACA